MITKVNDFRVSRDWQVKQNQSLVDVVLGPFRRRRRGFLNSLMPRLSATRVALTRPGQPLYEVLNSLETEDYKVVGTNLQIIYGHSASSVESATQAKMKSSKFMECCKDALHCY